MLASLLLLLLAPAAAWAGPVDWHEVGPTAAGRQWWDAGSLRLDRHGHLTVLSRFQPNAAPGPSNAAGVDRAPFSRLYVMELDCERERYRDTAVNGMPHFRAQWQGTEGDPLTRATIQAACMAGADLMAAAPHG